MSAPADGAARSAPTATGRADIDPLRPAGLQIHRLLRARIIRTELAPGEALSEASIAASCGVSRQPVREAFMRLADEGLIVVRPQRVTRVGRISRAGVLDARFVREAIEADVARAVARSPDPTPLLARLEACLDRQKAVSKRRPERFMALDEEFHRTLAEGAGHAHAWDVLEGVKAQMDRVRFLALRRFPVAALVAQHEAILEALATRRPAAAERAMRAHLRTILDDLPDIVAANPAMFDDDPVVAHTDRRRRP